MTVVMMHYDRKICQHASEELQKKKTERTSSYNCMSLVMSLKHSPTQTTMYNANVL